MRIELTSKPIRECGTCTRCCEGYLFGEVNNNYFYNGRPCHYVSPGTGCTIHEERPEMCEAFKCGWLSDPRIPEWLKPELSNAMISFTQVEGIPYLSLMEVGAKMDSKVLSWVLLFALENNYNFLYQVEGGLNTLGTQEFVDAFNRTKNKPFPQYVEMKG